MGWLLLSLLLCLSLSGCRTRTTGQDAGDPAGEAGERAGSSLPGSLIDDGADEDGDEDEAGGESGRTKENPEASRKEYDENAPAEIVPGAERTVHGEGEGGGAFAPADGAEPSVAKLSDTAEDTATQTVAADEADQMGVSEDAEEADSALTYYTVLLQDRTGSLFECQRLDAYWETAKDHVTVFKTSLEHGLILSAGAYDVSARLLEENLRVDDGWIGRKNPGVIVKAVDRRVLGTGVSSTAAARKAYAGLRTREGWPAIDAVRSGRVVLLSEELLQAPHLQAAAALIVARTAYPALFGDVDLEKALEMLVEEATGSLPVGIYYYSEQEGIG